MVAPLIIGAGITGAASLAGAGLGALAQGQAAGAALDAAQLQYNDAVQQRMLERAFAERMLGIQLADRIGPNGESQKYIPGYGFVTTIDPTLEQAIGAENAERLRRATEGAQRQAYEEEQSFSRRQDEGRLADLFLQRATGAPKYSQADVENTLSNASTAGINEGFDREAELGARQLTRSRSSNAGQIQAALAARRGEAIGNARAQAGAQALTLTPQLNAADQQQNLSVYDVLRGRSSNYNEVPITFNSAPSTNAFAATAQQGPGAALMSRSFRNVPIGATGPDLSSANFVNAAGSAIGGIFEQYAADQRYKDLLGVLQDRQRTNKGEF